jgi:MFS family permease
MAVRHSGLSLAVILSAMFVAQFDFFVVNVAAPSLRHDLHAGQASLELIVGGYAFAYATGMITGGRLGDRYGHRRLFVGGMLAFGLASLLCGLANNPAELVLARLLQGLAGAVMVPQVLALITATVSGPARGRALGWYGVASGLGSIGGQVLGGALLQADIFGLGWRVIFLVNVPVCAVLAPLARRMLPDERPARPARLDIPGAIGVSTTLALVLVPVTLGRSAGWPLWAWLSLAGSVVLAGFTWRQQRRAVQPVLDLDLLRQPAYRAGLVAGAAFMAYFASFMFTLTLLLQGGLGLSAFRAGLAFAPMGLAFMAAAVVGARLFARYGTPVVVVGTVMIGGGLAWLAAQPHVPWVIAAAILVGIGNGLVLPQLIAVALAAVRPDQAGIGAGMLTTGQQFAGAIGVAAVGAAFFAVSDATSAIRLSAALDLGLVVLVFVLVLTAARKAYR